LHPHVASARRYARRREDEVAFAAIDERGRLSGFHVAQTAPAASVFKVMLLVAFLRMRGGRRLSGADRDLLGPMIRRSDSVAATRVRDIVGRRRVERVARVAGMRDFRYAGVWGLSHTSPRDQARFMYRLESYVPGPQRAYALHLLSHIVRPQRWGIGRVAPRGWRLFFKGGWGSGSGRVDHQVALLERGRRRVAVAIFTQFDGSHRYGKRTLRGVAARLLRGLPATRAQVPATRFSHTVPPSPSARTAARPAGPWPWWRSAW
jgi:hypothetical protein